MLIENRFIKYALLLIFLFVCGACSPKKTHEELGEKFVIIQSRDSEMSGEILEEACEKIVDIMEYTYKDTDILENYVFTLQNDIIITLDVDFVSIVPTNEHPVIKGMVRFKNELTEPAKIKKAEKIIDEWILEFSDQFMKSSRPFFEFQVFFIDGVNDFDHISIIVLTDDIDALSIEEYFANISKLRIKVKEAGYNRLKDELD